MLFNECERGFRLRIERERLVQVRGDGVMSEDYDFGGISGGPLIAIVQTPTIDLDSRRCHYSGSQSYDISQSIQGFEMIKARPVQYISPDAASMCLGGK